jgi:hypothetical protein
MVALPLRASLPWLWLFVLSGCASSSNSAWLREPEEGLLVGERTREFETSARSDAFSGSIADGPEIANEASHSRTRLRHTVTLGETIAPAPEPSAAAAPAGNPAPVVVTVNNYVTAAVPVYGRWVEPLPGRAARSHGSAPRGVSPSPTRGGSSPPVSWPGPPSYGPSFPFKTAPASPWR